MNLKTIAGIVLSVLVSVGGYLAYNHFVAGRSGSHAVAGNEADAASGSFKATGGKLGKWEMKVTGCQSGEKHHFDGVILFDKADKTRHIRLVRALGGKYDVLAQFPGSVDAVVVPKCKAEAKIERTGNNINFHDEVRGSVKFTCPELSGSAEFPSCY